jgi:hypothetical protein
MDMEFGREMNFFGQIGLRQIGRFDVDGRVLARGGKSGV